VTKRLLEYKYTERKKEWTKNKKLANRLAVKGGNTCGIFINCRVTRCNEIVLSKDKNKYFHLEFYFYVYRDHEGVGTNPRLG